MSKQADKEREEARTKLLAFIKPGDTIYTILRHVSTSGMLRVIDLYVIRDGEPWWIGGLARTVLGNRSDNRKQGLRVGGCGMDMGFHLVYELSHALFPTGFGCIGEKCPSNDHTNGDRDYTVHGVPITTAQEHTRGAQQLGVENPYAGEGPGPTSAASHWHKDGGYALRHRWL